MTRNGTGLQDALQVVADRHEPGAAPDDLWSRGVRRKRWRAATGAASVVVVLALGAGVGAWLPGTAPEQVRPSGGAGAPAIPTKIYVPSPKIPGTSDAGAPGRLALVASAPRDHADGYRLFGVSATTGDYRFLDLPDQADLAAQDHPVALSPDGRHLAYWITGGEVTGTPAPGNGPAPRVAGPLPTVTGVGIYDTVTGHLVTHQLTSAHGLMANDLAWADSATLLFNYGRVTRFSSSRLSSTRVHTWAWPVGRSNPRRIGTGDFEPDSLTAGPGGSFTLGGNPARYFRSVAVVDAGRGAAVRLPHQAFWEQVSVNGSRVAAVQDGPTAGTVDGRGWLLTGQVSEGDARPAMRRVPTTFKVSTIVGWQGQSRVLVVGWKRYTVSLLSVDLVDRTVRVVGSVQQDAATSPSFQLASSLASHLAARPAPPLPGTGPELVHVVVGVGGAAVLLSCVGLLVWRRRARR